MAGRSTRGKLIVAQNSGHWIQLDEPELVAAAVREILESLR
jgi:pimeloyl-ACP methyl ester carboxylesterase